MQALSRVSPHALTGLACRKRLFASFAELYRHSITSAPLARGDALQGHVVGQSRPRSSASRFYIVDFGLKTEAPFTPNEIPGSSSIGDSVSIPLLELEDDFNEPVFDQDRRMEIPALQAERYQLLTRATSSDSQILHGRIASFRRVGAGVKVLGMDAFAPRHHVVSLDRPVIGSYAPFYVLNVSTEKRDSSHVPGLDVNPVVSSYGGYLFCIANLVGLDSAWKDTGGGSSKDRQAYLRLLTRLLNQKNTSVRRILPKSADSDGSYQRRRKRRGSRRTGEEYGDTAWLNDLPQGDWMSSETARAPERSQSWHHSKPDVQKPEDQGSLIRRRERQRTSRSGPAKTRR